jgi:hypothetical protein
MTATRPVLLGPSDIPTGLPLLALDVDGVLNVFDDPDLAPPAGLSSRLVRTAHGAKYRIDFDDIVIDALDELVASGRVGLGWLTTWGPNARALVEKAFDGRLAGGFVLAKQPPRYRGAIPATWKHVALRTHLAAHPRPYAWVDDEAIAMAGLTPGADDASAFPASPGLLIATDPAVGLTFNDVTRIAAHLDPSGA